MASCNPINFVIWLLILLFISFFIAGFCAPFYILIYCLSACITSLGCVVKPVTVTVDKTVKTLVNFFSSFSRGNMRNIEIKARVDNPEDFLVKVKEISESKETVIPQKDIFFNLPTDRPGRLKLRKYKDGTGELVYYNRPDMEGPKLSTFEKTFLTPDACNGIEKILSTAYGTLGIVEKVRLLYLVGQTRIHVDQVTGLGSFMELEVSLADNETIEHGEKISKDLMEKLEITKDSLISGAYMDLLLKK